MESIKNPDSVDAKDSSKNLILARSTPVVTLLKDKYEYILSQNPDFEGIIGEDFYDSSFPKMISGNKCLMSFCECYTEDFIELEFRIPKVCDRIQVGARINIENLLKSENYIFSYMDGEEEKTGILNEEIILENPTNIIRLKFESSGVKFIYIDSITILYGRI
jgi:hypothetical protein